MPVISILDVPAISPFIVRAVPFQFKDFVSPAFPIKNLGVVPAAVSLPNQNPAFTVSVPEVFPDEILPPLVIVKLPISATIADNLATLK